MRGNLQTKPIAPELFGHKAIAVAHLVPIGYLCVALVTGTPNQTNKPQYY
ncbi:hypothetical protein [Thalassoporum mexicanum]|nr:hypothetical protein [Pseudanabaena sp. PCC 7367]